MPAKAMEEFLRASKRPLSGQYGIRAVRVVLGNPTCDLDSAVCALVQGFCEYLDTKQGGELDIRVIPILNVPECEFRIKTEVVYHLKRYGIPLDLLTFRDQIDLKKVEGIGFTRLQVVLVDHHALAAEDAFLREKVVKVIDHRPQDPAWPWPGRMVTLETVGSCASLVARNLYVSHPHVLSQINNFLLGPILLDTCNLSVEAGRTTPLDYEMVDFLEKVGPTTLDRTEVFEGLIAAKTNISGLSGDDLMIRDLKVTAGVPIVGLPLSVANFLSREDSLSALERFAGSRNTRIIIIMGIELVAGHVSRDIAVFGLYGDTFNYEINKALTSSTNPALELQFPRHIIQGPFELHLYKQDNIKATRKHILPIIREVATAQACH